MMNELTEKVMSIIGLDINHEFKVMDQDTGLLLTFNDKYLKFSYSDEIPIIGENDMWLDLLNNVKIVIYIFTYFLEKNYILTNTYIRSFSQINDGIKTALDVRGDSNITSNFYTLSTLKYLDIIFRLSEYDNVDFIKKYDIN